MPVSHCMPVFNKSKGAFSQEVQSDRKNGDGSEEDFSSYQHQGFHPKDSSESEEEVSVSRVNQIDGGGLLEFLHQEDGSALSDQQFYQRLQILKEAHQEKLMETSKLFQGHLEQRILEDSLLSVETAGNVRKTTLNKDVEQFFSSSGRQHLIANPSKLSASRNGSLRKSSSLSELSSRDSQADRESPPFKGTQRPVSSSSAWASGTTVPQPFNMTLREAQKKTQLPKSRTSLDLEKQLVEKREAEEAEEAECQKQFRAVPIPAHVYLPLFDEINESREKQRRLNLDRRKEILLSIQKPFSFAEREEKKKEQTRQMLRTAPPSTLSRSIKPKVKNKIPKSVQDPTISDHLKEYELYRKIRIQMRATDLLKTSSAPIQVQPQKRELDKSSALKTKKKTLGYLDKEPTFQPRTNPEVPNFERLYRAFQKEAMRRKEQTESTKCKPFQLRTSNLPPRQSRSTEDAQQESSPVIKTRLKRSKSFNGILSLSTDTLPTYITDAARKRQAAIRSSLEQKDNKEQESAKWMKQYRLKSEAMNKAVTTRAKAMDTHRSLKDVYKEKLKQHRQTDQHRMREYKKELEEMKNRIHDRPYLFEQVTKRNAKTEAERRYRDTLKQVGLNEDFVRNKGRNAGGTPLCVSDGEEDQSSDSKTQYSRSESVISSAENQTKEEPEKTNEEEMI
ncbi:protein FAM161B-like isoform X1 [Acipenser ruthenus]|uniref:protein FAM161B-like isoform X1 n=1 Tax=Acipenser ruthenus TaxID=7906 RepID=UPI00145A2D6C|nr:protein FAM161B-like isoform X1 [Acipenser ruthenus]